MTMDEFNQIQPGMSQNEVTVIVGGAGELLSQSDLVGIHTEMRMWDGPDAGGQRQRHVPGRRGHLEGPVRALSPTIVTKRHGGTGLTRLFVAVAATRASDLAQDGDRLLPAIRVSLRRSATSAPTSAAASSTDGGDAPAGH